MTRIARILTASVFAGAVLTMSHFSGSPAAIGQDDSDKSNTQAAEKLPQPLLDTHHLMELFNKPLYKQMKSAMQEEPGQDKGWQTIADRGLQTAEVMNLVAMRNDDSTWQKHSLAVYEAGIQLNKEAEKRSWIGARKAYSAVIGGCNACHSRFAPEEAPKLQP